MAKTAKSPIATRTRSKKTAAITKKRNIFNVKVNLVRLTQKQIETAMANNLIDKPKYNLRQRIKKEGRPPNPIANKKKKSSATNQICNKEQMTAERLWVVLKRENDKEVENNMYCLSKMRTFSPWPSKVLNTNEKTTEVYFFGDGTTGKVATAEIVPLDKCVSLMKKLFHLNGYIRAVREMEIYLGIPQHASITRFN